MRLVVFAAAALFCGTTFGAFELQRSDVEWAFLDSEDNVAVTPGVELPNFAEGALGDTYWSIDFTGNSITFTAMAGDFLAGPSFRGFAFRDMLIGDPITAMAGVITDLSFTSNRALDPDRAFIGGDGTSVFFDQGGSPFYSDMSGGFAPNWTAGDYVTLNLTFSDAPEDPDPTLVPEPGSLALLGTGVVGLFGAWARRRRRSAGQRGREPGV